MVTGGFRLRALPLLLAGTCIALFAASPVLADQQTDQGMPPPMPGPMMDSSGPANGPPLVPLWYYCGAPVGYFPYVKTCTDDDWHGLPPMPPPPGAGPPLSEHVWNYCDETRSFYPYVATCAHRWVSVPAGTPDAAGSPDRRPPVANWFYCDEARGYFPFVQTCRENWRPVPSVPPPTVSTALPAVR